MNRFVFRANIILRNIRTSNRIDKLYSDIGAHTHVMLKDGTALSLYTFAMSTRYFAYNTDTYCTVDFYMMKDRKNCSIQSNALKNLCYGIAKLENINRYYGYPMIGWDKKYGTMQLRVRYAIRNKRSDSLNKWILNPENRKRIVVI